MANKNFGIKQLNLVGESGTPTIESPNNLNLTASIVAISTDMIIGGQIQSNLKIGSSYSVGIGTTNPTSALTVIGNGTFTGIVTATTFSGSGSGLTNIPSGQLSGALPAIDGSALTNLPASSITFTISASDSSNYTFSGPGIVSGNTLDPVLYLYKGFTYNFINTTGGSHPFAIRVSNGGASYTPGVSGSTTGTQTFIVPMNAPSTLYYQCTIHGSMGNTINII